MLEASNRSPQALLRMWRKGRCILCPSQVHTAGDRLSIAGMEDGETDVGRRRYHARFTHLPAGLPLLPQWHGRTKAPPLLV